MLGLLRWHLSNKEIGRALAMEEATVEVHVRKVMRRLGAANRIQAALLARSPSPAQRGRAAGRRGPGA